MTTAATTLVLLLATLTSLHVDASAAEPTAAKADLVFPGESIDHWHGHVRHRFSFDGHDAWVVEPATALPGNPWSWCMMFPDAFTQRCAAPQLVTAGFHHAFLDVGNTFGSPAAVAKLDAFHDELVRRGLARRPALIGISRGGLYAHRYAAEHADKVAVIYGDGAVCDFKSWPGGKGKGKGSPKDWAACLEAYGFADQTAALAYRGNPVDTLPTLAAAGIALVHVVGDDDDVVPPADNAEIVTDRYRKLGGRIELIHKPGCGHHPHGLDDPRPVVDFIVKFAGVPDARPAIAAPAAPQAEPTDAAEAAAKKAAQEAAVNEKYAALVAGLSAEEQAWERVLQEQLGSFYLPLHKADKVAGRGNAWDFVRDDPSLPRVLLIGDSVSRGYTLAARKALAGEANVHRAPANCGPTASGLKHLDVWLGDGRWDLVHFNFGIHDRNTPVADYADRLEKLVERMKKTGARLVWATTTPIPDVAETKQTASSIVERNAAAAAVMDKHGVAVDDLFGFITPHLGEVQPPNDVHFTGKGYDLLGGKVAESIREHLRAAEPPQADSAAAWKARVPGIRRRMQEVMGPLPGPADPARRSPPEFEILAEQRGDGHVRRKIRYVVDDGDRVPAWLLVPEAAADAAGTPRRHPAMLCLHQTTAVGKDEPAGLGGLPGLHYARELAARGFVCLVPDYPRFGEYKSSDDLAATGYASGSMQAVWNNIRGVDLLASLPQVDPDRIGAIGHSLGGHNAIFTAAFDERLQAVVTSCGFTPFPDYFGGDLAGWTSRTYMPRIRDAYGCDPKRMPFDFPQVIASLAPRGFFASAPVDDGNFSVAGVRRTFAEVAPIYGLFAAGDRLELVTPDAGHEFPQTQRERAYAWLDRVLVAHTAAADPGPTAAHEGGGIRVAPFDVDATPPLGAAMAYGPVVRVADLQLRCRGVVLLGAGEPIVLCSVDWIGIGNAAHDAFRAALAEAAGTTPGRVAVHVIHQHDAPHADFTAEKLLREMGLRSHPRFDGDFHREVIGRAATAVAAAVPKARTATHVGFGRGTVERVASNRRLLDADGKFVAWRGSATKDPQVAAWPEGTIDPEAAALVFFAGDEPLAVITSYACHPMSYYRTGIPGPDFPGIARLIRSQDLPAALHVHFTGAAGNVAAGKYNDGAHANRMQLALRLAAGMRAAYAAAAEARRPLAAADVDWKGVPVTLAARAELDRDALAAAIRARPDRGTFSSIDALAFAERAAAKRAVDVTCLRVGRARMLHMPGELFVEYQLAARAMRPDLDVFMAAYGDYGPGYIGTAASYAQGGYETQVTSSFVGPEAEEPLMAAMRQLLEAPSSESEIAPALPR